MNSSQGWLPVVRSVEKRHSCLTSLRLTFRQTGRASKRCSEKVPDFLKIAIAAATENIEAKQEKPTRLAIIAPRWNNGAFWTAVGAALCILKRDFERVKMHLPDFEIGQRLLLDKNKVVQYEGEDTDGLRLRVDNGRGVLTVPHSYRLRLQPTTSKRPLSIVPFAGKSKPDLLDELLGIECQGARHIFSTRVALVSAVARAVETARRVEAGPDTEPVFEPIPNDERMKALGQIRRVKHILFPHETVIDRAVRLNFYILRAEELAALSNMKTIEQKELASRLEQAIELLCHTSGRGEAREYLSRALSIVLSIVQSPVIEKPDAVELLNLFQWGGLDQSGSVEIKSAGQADAEPVLLLSPDLLALRQFLRTKAAQSSRSKEKTTYQPPLIVLDGAASFRNRLDVLNGVLDSGAPVLACLERGEEEAAGLLAERGFEVWRWAPDDIRELVQLDAGEAAQPLFGGWQQALHNYARHRLQEQVCVHEALGAAADNLVDLLNGLDAAQPEVRTLEGVLYGNLLFVARLLHQPESETLERLNERLGRAREELANCGVWLSDETRNRAESVLKSIEEAAFAGHDGGKMTELRAVVSASQAPCVAVVVADAEAVEAARRHWEQEQRAEAALADKTVSFCCPTTVEAHLSASGAEHLVICGWLGAARMRRLLDGCLAADISLLLYPFERGWLRGALWRWRVRGEPLSAARRLKLLGLSRSDVQFELRENAEEPLAKLRDEVSSGEQKAAGFDVTEFEMRLRVHRRACLASARRPGEETEAARLVEFSGDHFAFLSESCRLPLVNELMLSSGTATSTASARKSDLPQKRSGELTVGDYVVFRQGAAGNVIRDIADLSLRRAGLNLARGLSGLWKVALREWVEREKECAAQAGESSSRLVMIRRLQKAGIDRCEQTIGEWLERGRVIGPRDPEETLAIIADVTGHEELKRRLPEVVYAISRVHSAHLTAADYLARTLLERLPGYLAKNVDANTFLEGVLEIEIEGVGAAVVVRVEEITADLTPVARSQINVLQCEPEESYAAVDLFDAPVVASKDKADAIETTAGRTAAADRKMEQLLRENGF